MEINIRVVYGFQSIGVGHPPLTKLYGFLNTPSPITKKVYDGLSCSKKAAPKQVAEKSVSDAAARLHGTEPIADVGVSIDDT